MAGSLPPPAITKHVAALIVALGLAACAPKGVQSPVEKSPPPEIELARRLVASGDAAGARQAYERFMIAHPGTVEADLARLELGILEAANSGCERAIPHFVQASDSNDRAIALRASLRYATCQLDARQPDEALETLLPLSADRFAETEQALLWDTAVEASEQSLDPPLALAVLDGLLQHGGPPPDPPRLDAVLQILAMKLSVEQAVLVFEELSPGAAPQVAVAGRLLEHGLQTQDAELISRSSEVLRNSPAVEDLEVRMLVTRADEFLHGNPFAVGALLPLSGRGREVGRQLLQGMQLAALHEGGPEILVEDTAGDPSTTAGAAEELIRDRRVVALLGPVGARTTAAAAQATEDTDVPLLSFSVAEGAVTKRRAGLPLSVQPSRRAQRFGRSCQGTRGRRLRGLVSRPRLRTHDAADLRGRGSKGRRAVVPRCSLPARDPLVRRVRQDGSSGTL